jgi:urease accessory protein
LRTRLRVERDGVALLHHELRLGPDAPGWDGPAVLGDARVCTTVLLVDPAWAASGPPDPVTAGTATARAAALPLAGPAVLVTVLAAGVGEGQALLAEVLADVLAGVPAPALAGAGVDHPVP